MVKARESSNLTHYLDEQFKDVIYRLAIALGLDPNTFNSKQALRYTEVLYPMFMQQLPLPQGIDNNLIHNLTALKFSAFNFTINQDRIL